MKPSTWFSTNTVCRVFPATSTEDLTLPLYNHRTVNADRWVVLSKWMVIPIEVWSDANPQDSIGDVGYSLFDPDMDADQYPRWQPAGVPGNSRDDPSRRYTPGSPDMYRSNISGVSSGLRPSLISL